MTTLLQGEWNFDSPDGIAFAVGRQGRLQGLGIGHAGGLIGSDLGLQALQFLVAELHGGELRCGFVRERVGVVVNVVDFMSFISTDRTMG